MKKFVIVYFLSGLFYIIHAQTTVEQMLTYHDAIFTRVQQASASFVDWQKTLPTDDNDWKWTAYKQLSTSASGLLVELNNLQAIPEDMGFLNNARRLVRILTEESDIDDEGMIYKITAYARGGDKNEKSDDWYYQKLLDVESRLRDQEAVMNYYRALLFTRFEEMPQEQEFCAMMPPLLAEAKTGLQGYKGYYKSQVDNREKEYYITQLLPGAIRGSFITIFDKPRVEFVYVSSTDSASVYKYFEQIAMHVIACELYGASGKFYVTAPGYMDCISICDMDFYDEEYSMSVLFRFNDALQEYEAVLLVKGVEQ